jgi:hypothetical protein
MLLISEQEWQDIGCEVCHPGEPNQISGEIAFLDLDSPDGYLKVSSVKILCDQCHLATDIEGHNSTIVMGTHTEMGCADCHDPHTGAASCTASGCHQTFAEECDPIHTHDKPHREVTCSACHDAQDLKIDWNEDLHAWDTFFPQDEGTPDDYRPHTSHFLLLAVDCDRCHEPGNHPWGY